MQERGDSCISSPESSPLRSSTSRRRLAAFLVCLAGGGESVGDCSGVGDGGGAISGLGWGTVGTMVMVEQVLMPESGFHTVLRLLSVASHPSHWHRSWLPCGGDDNDSGAL